MGKGAAAEPTCDACDAPVKATTPGKKCWGCGKVEPDGVTFQTCARCREDGLEPCPFCSKECLKANWPRHKKWHEEQKTGNVGDNNTASEKEKRVINTMRNVLKDQPESDAKKYMALLMRADELKLTGAYTAAEKLLRQAVTINDQNPIGYSALGEIQALCNRPKPAAEYYIKAMSLYPKTANASPAPGKNLWASSALSAIFWLNTPESAGDDPNWKPSWFNDDELKELTSTLVCVAPDDVRSWQTRAFVLCPQPDMPPQWRVGEAGLMRTEAELIEAGRCWQKVMEMTPGGKEEKRPLVARAAHCFRTAQVVAEKMGAQQKKLEEEAKAKEAVLTKAAADEAIPAF